MDVALLLSGGMDSICIAYWKRPKYGITIDYGHNPRLGEIQAASTVCKALNIEHIVITADISALGSGDLVGTTPVSDAPASEWWPYRNQFLITLAAMKCQSINVSNLMIGTLRTDGFHSDGRPEFIELMNDLFTMQEGHLTISSPAIKLSAVELVEESGIPLSILSWSHSCHTSEVACGFCRGCRKHYETMEKCFGTAY